MKRFWKQVATRRDDDGWGLELDGRPLKTPARVALRVPTAALAGAIADEWRGSAEQVNPREMPLTGLANAAVDQIAPDQQAFATGLAKYAEADLACYRAEGPATLVARQEEHWDALLAWARRRFDLDFQTTNGLMHVQQPQATIDRLGHAVHALDAFQLAGLSPLVTIGGSLIAALAVVEGAMTVEKAWDAISIDERWQLEQWGSDAEAELALENRRRDFFAAARFEDLLKRD